MKYALATALAAAALKALPAESNPPREHALALAKPMGSPSEDGQ